MRAHKLDVKRLKAVSHGHDQAVVVALDVEHHAAIFKHTGIAKMRLDVCRLLSAVNQFDGSMFKQDEGHCVSPLWRTCFGLRHMACGHHHQTLLTTFWLVKMTVLVT